METSKVELWTSLRNAVVAVLIPAVLFGAAFLWGTIYHQTRLEVWGFNASLFPLTTQQTYVQAVFPAVGAAAAPAAWTEQYLGVWFGFLVVIPTFLFAWLGKRFSTTVERWLKEHRENGMPAEDDTSAQSAVRWGATTFLVLLGPLAISVAIVLLLGLAIVPPYLLALRDGHRAWEREDYKSWAVATWTEDTGPAQSAFVERCNDRWCALITARREALSIPVGKVKRVSKTATTTPPAPAPTP